jgi:hypothetical protein
MWQDTGSPFALSNRPRTTLPQCDSNSRLRFRNSWTLKGISASHRHGMLQLTLPVKESVKPRRIQIDGVTDQKQIPSAA